MSSALSPPPLPTLAAARFRGTWRPYQARVLGALGAHVADGRVHLVAPPGSGKTLVGLEALRRLGRPALVLSPTLALRDQWLDRWREHFDAAGVALSTDLAAPGTITSATYQGLHAAHASDPEATLAALRHAGVATLVVDEAHHLRRAWWRTLRAVRAALDGAAVVALTATPPYDVPTAEWGRYRAFCGPPDAEISTPELVRAGHLCPHLDAVHLALPAEADRAALDAQRAAAAAFVQRFVGGTWVGHLAAHPWIADPAGHADAIVDEDPDWAVAALALLHEAGEEVAPAAAALGIVPPELPAPRMSTVGRVLDGVLGPQREAFEALAGGAAVRALGAELKRLGLRIGSRTALHAPPGVRRALGRSASKIDAVAEIMAFEHEHRGADLRAVALADRVHAEAWDPDHTAQPRLGVAPIVTALQAVGTLGGDVAALTGSFAAVPPRVVPALRDEVVAAGLDAARLEAAPVADGLVRVALAGDGSPLVGPMTRLFERGAARVLVGTVALLGEGWDAPAANVLVMASYAATFVQTGQMRGRVLRLDPARPDKVAAVWHLGCVEPDAADGGPDVARLARRFAAFAGPREMPRGAPRLETGLARLGVPPPPYSAASVAAANAATFADAIALDRVRALWRDALGDDADGHALRPLVRVPSGAVPLAPTVRVRSARRFGAFADVVGVGTAAASGGAAGWVGALALGVVGPTAGAFGVIGGGLAMIGASLRLEWRDRAERRDIGAEGQRLRAVGATVLDALIESGLVQAAGAAVRVERSRDRLDVRLEGGSGADAEAFAEALAAAAAPVASPRYLLHDEAGDAHAVPDALGARKALAELYLAAWRRRIGPADLTFTRTPAGRRALAAARARSLGAPAAVETVRRWSRSSS